MKIQTILGQKMMAMCPQVFAESEALLAQPGVECLRNIRYAADSAQFLRQSQSTKGGKTGILYLTGFLEQTTTLYGQIVGGTNTQRFRAELNQMANDSSVARILVWIDTPGGTVPGTLEVSNAIYEARSKKEIIGCIGPLCASGGYWIASACTALAIQPSGYCGSVGVFMLHMDRSAMLEMEGVKPTLFAYPEHKAEANPFFPLSEETKLFEQSEVEKEYRKFVTSIARNRGVSVAHIDQYFGRGRTLDAEAAVRSGMVDAVADFETVLLKPERIGNSKPRWSMSVTAWDSRVVLQKAELRQRAAELRQTVAAGEIKVPEIIATISALVIPFNRTGYPCEGETEIILPGSVAGLLNSSAEVSLARDHDPAKIVAKRSAFNLRLSATDAGLFMEADIPGTFEGRQLLEVIQKKRLAGWSFGINLAKSRFTETKLAGKTHRRFTALVINHISAITWPGKPAYVMTTPPTVAMRKPTKNSAVA